MAKANNTDSAVPVEPDEPVVTSVDEANKPPEGVSAGPDHGDNEVKSDARPDPKAYRSTKDEYRNGIYTKAGDPFITSDDKSDDWTEIPADALPAVIASTSKVPPNSSLENLEVAALQAIAFMKNVITTGIEGDKGALVTAIKAAYEPSL